MTSIKIIVCTGKEQKERKVIARVWPRSIGFGRLLNGLSLLFARRNIENVFCMHSFVACIVVACGVHYF